MEVEGCPLPEDRRYDVEHEVWIAPVAGTPDRFRLGVAAVLGAFAGRFIRLEYRALTEPIDAGRSLATLESIRYTGAVRTPFAAELLEQNPAILATPKLLNNDPYGAGWVATLRAVDPAAPARTTLAAAAAASGFREKIRARRIRCFRAVPDVELYEIGAECSAVLARLDEEIARIPAGDVVLLVTDDPTSPIEMVRWSDRTGHTVLQQRSEGALEQFLVRREAEPRPRRPGR